jgi:hypothetical protein
VLLSVVAHAPSWRRPPCEGFQRGTSNVAPNLHSILVSPTSESSLAAASLVIGWSAEASPTMQDASL